MATIIKYIGSQDRWSELPTTGKQSIWHLGQQESRSDAEAAQLLATGFFAIVPRALIGIISSLAPNNNDGMPDGTIYIQTA